MSKGSEEAVERIEDTSKRLEDRIRGYFYKVKNELMKCDVYKNSLKGKNLILDLLNYWKHLVAGVDDFSCMFVV